MFFKWGMVLGIMYKPDILTEEMYGWWLKFFDNAGITPGLNLPWEIDLDRDEGRIFIKSPSGLQVIGFDGVLDIERKAYIAVRETRRKRERDLVPTVTFFALNLALNNALRGRLESGLVELGEEQYTERAGVVVTNDIPCLESVASSFNEQKKLKLRDSDKVGKAFYKGTFFDPKVYFGRTTYEDVSHRGVLVRAPIIKIPVGEGGGLSEKLFDYARRYVLSPLVNSMLG